jgi:hypothetical protein
MRRVVRQRLVLVAIVVALGGAVGWQVHSDNHEAGEHRLLPLAKTVDDLQVVFRGAAPLHFVKHDGHWRDASTQAPVDDGWVDEMAALGATPVREWRSAGEFEADKIGLSPPAAMLTLDGRRVEYGDLAAVGQQRYVRVDNRIGFIPDGAMPRAPRTKSL